MVVIGTADRASEKEQGVDVRIREQNLPGIGHRYELPVDANRSLMVVVQRGGGRQIVISRPDAEEPVAVVTLTHEQAMAVAALLTGARFAIEADREHAPGGDVAVETITLSERSPAVGRRVRDVPLLAGADAAILAIIRDDTPQLVEDEDTQPCRAGDRVVVAARQDRLAVVARELAG